MNNLKNLRKKKGYSIRKLSDLTGIPLRTLEDWDAEKRQIQSYHRIKALSRILDCDMDDLMTKEEKCKFGQNKASVCMIQEEDGVCVSVISGDCEEIFATTIPREDALEILQHIKMDEDIKPFLCRNIKNT